MPDSVWTNQEGDMAVTTIIAIIVVVVIVLVGLALWWNARQRKVSNAQQRFGSEFDRAVEEHGGNKQEAASDLQERQERVEKVTIHPLTADERQQYSTEWQSIQTQFVDDPGGAVTRADDLITQVMDRIGYEAGQYGQRTDVVSVKYPDAAENYRTAHDLAQKQESGDATTEDLRNAMLRYRTLFEQLVGVPLGSQTEATQ
jgi:FtsZ-interacting cell division protein ZipA